MKNSINNYFKPFLIIAGVLLLQSCKKDSLCNCFESTGKEISEIRTLPPFINIEMNNDIDLLLKQGSEQKVVVTCGKNLIDGIETKVIGDRLYVQNKNKCNWLRDFKNKFTIEITFTDLNYITNNGTGNLTCLDTINTSFFQVDNWNGTGTLNLLLNCNEVYLKSHTGPADIYAAGKTGILYIYSAGNGFVKAADVDAVYCNVNSRSTGDCEIKASQEINANIEYNGDVLYKGSPPVIHAEISGNGKLIPF